ncbi:MAG: NUDIX hydrolase [Firmicutes bacterium]|nr:NUDIX hydrolase [Bacillota bacterium]
MGQKLEEVFQANEFIHQGNFLEFHRDRVLLPNGKTATREYIKHPGAVAALPLLSDGSALLVKQFRYPTGQTLLEIPAGKLEPGEDPVACIRRELAEETGYQPGELIHLASVWTTPGFTDEIIHLYLATRLEPAFLERDADEFLEILRLSKSELLDYLNNGTVVDGKTVLAVSLVEMKKLW